MNGSGLVDRDDHRFAPDATAHEVVNEILSDLFKPVIPGDEVVFLCKFPFEFLFLILVKVGLIDDCGHLLIEVYDDYHNGIITKGEFIEILRLTENYVFRRAVCSIPTNSLNKTFSTLSRDIDKDNYLESFKGIMKNKDSYRRFPSDEEFKRELRGRDLYHFRNIKYLLRKLENYETKEPLNIENYTIEHIMPQNENLSPEWRDALGDRWEEVHEEYLHTLGNLTLTGYNPELSDRPFIEKRDMDGGLGSSHIRLNHGLSKVETWNEEEIKKRALRIAKKAVNVWDYPDLDKTVACYYNGEHPYVPKSSRPLYHEIIDCIHDLNTNTDFYPDSDIVWVETEQMNACIQPDKTQMNFYVDIPFDEIHVPDGIMVEDGTEFEKYYSRIVIQTIDQFKTIQEILENPDDFCVKNDEE